MSSSGDYAPSDDDASEQTTTASTASSDANHDNAVYIAICRRLQVVPSSKFMRTRNLVITDLCLSDNRLGKDGARHVADMLTENACISVLDISDNSIGSEGARMVCDMIAENNSLTSLNLSGNNIKNQDGKYFSDLLRNPRSARLVDLNLSHNHIEESGGQQLALAIKHNRWLKTLNLSWNHIRRKGATSICKALKLNLVLTDVDLSWNGLGDEGAVLIAEVLQENAILLSLSVAYNRFSIKGINVITEGLRRNNTLQIFRVGGNMVTHAGSMDLLTVLETNVETAIVTLDLGDSPVKQEFVDLLDELRSERPELDVIYGCLVTDFDLYAILARGRSKYPVNPICVLRDYIVDNGLRCHDLFYRFDANKDQIVTRTEFRKGILKTGLPLSAAERGKLYRRIDKNNHGFFEYREFAEVFEERVRNERRRRLRVHLDAKEPREPTPLPDSDEELLA